MTEDEWFQLGDKRVKDWERTVRSLAPGHAITLSFQSAWELAGREMGIVK